MYMRSAMRLGLLPSAAWLSVILRILGPSAAYTYQVVSGVPDALLWVAEAFSCPVRSQPINVICGIDVLRPLRPSFPSYLYDSNEPSTSVELRRFPATPGSRRLTSLYV